MWRSWPNFRHWLECTGKTLLWWFWVLGDPCSPTVLEGSRPSICNWGQAIWSYSSRQVLASRTRNKVVLTVLYRPQRRKLVTSRSDNKDHQWILLWCMPFFCKDRVIHSVGLTCCQKHQAKPRPYWRDPNSSSFRLCVVRGKGGRTAALGTGATSSPVWLVLWGRVPLPPVTHPGPCMMDLPAALCNQGSLFPAYRGSKTATTASELEVALEYCESKCGLQISWCASGVPGWSPDRKLIWLQSVSQLCQRKHSLVLTVSCNNVFFMKGSFTFWWICFSSHCRLALEVALLWRAADGGVQLCNRLGADEELGDRRVCRAEGATDGLAGTPAKVCSHQTILFPSFLFPSRFSVQGRLLPNSEKPPSWRQHTI